MGWHTAAQAGVCAQMLAALWRQSQTPLFEDAEDNGRSCIFSSTFGAHVLKSISLMQLHKEAQSIVRPHS